MLSKVVPSYGAQSAEHCHRDERNINAPASFMQQQRKRNRGKRIVEDGQEKIDNSISEAQAQYLREEKELEANFQDKLNEIEANMAGVTDSHSVFEDHILFLRTKILKSCYYLCLQCNFMQKSGSKWVRSMMHTFRQVLQHDEQTIYLSEQLDSLPHRHTPVKSLCNRISYECRHCNTSGRSISFWARPAQVYVHTNINRCECPAHGLHSP